MSKTENEVMESKSIKLLENFSECVKDLSKGFIAFANLRGGNLFLGIEDGYSEPPENQEISDDSIEKLVKAIRSKTKNLNFSYEKIEAINGSQYIKFSIQRNPYEIAATTSGQYSIRDGNVSRPLHPEEMARFMTDRPAFSWELIKSDVEASEYDRNLFDEFLNRIRASDRVTDFVKSKTAREILEHYFFIKDNVLTNLGILCIGTREQRAMLNTAPIVQVIKYDQRDEKVQKWLWDDLALPPWKLEEVIWQEIPEWKESYELSSGLFRDSMQIYDSVVVRELLSNAFVHRPYTQRGDVFIRFYPGYMEITNPGTLPLGVTPQNILHTSIKRNELLAKVFYDLGLMEREGSGYDKIYEILLSQGQELPLITEDHDRVSVRITKRVIDSHIVMFTKKADEVYQLTQKEKICLGLLAQKKSANVMELVRILNLNDAEALSQWIGRLSDMNLITVKGRTRGKTYSVDANTFRTLKFTGKTTLGAIEPHRLKALIEEDLKINECASISEIHSRVGREVPLHQLRDALKEMINMRLIEKTGKKKGTRYVYLKKEG